MKSRIILLLAILFLCGCVAKKYPDVLYQEYHVVKVENLTIGNQKTVIVYQVKSEIKERASPYDLDADSKRDIGAIVYYVFKNTDADVVQIICYYAGSGEMQLYYKFKIDRKNAKLSGILDANENNLYEMALFSYSKLKYLGDLWINTRLKC
ncbi:hypothetical protein J422_01755 [Methanocaldococcus villosus KIN24-T80]|uniref:Lipoprotein n=1 Tax=Methanocaldococcus villosus KIN24-T80 TaxID=1069083 RepID=N6UW03_9EURY|nr:hypothetical protein [Methanocaldococcus villosus]ENN96504.1 hypothetical protein J422_01755 [Methanocaldococcus villosus KIN24-T80]